MGKNKGKRWVNVRRRKNEAVKNKLHDEMVELLKSAGVNMDFNPIPACVVKHFYIDESSYL